MITTSSEILSQQIGSPIHLYTPVLMATTTSYVLAIIILLNLSVTVLASLLLQQNQGLNDKWKNKKEVFLT